MCSVFVISFYIWRLEQFWKQIPLFLLWVLIFTWCGEGGHETDRATPTFSQPFSWQGRNPSPNSCRNFSTHFWILTDCKVTVLWGYAQLPYLVNWDVKVWKAKTGLLVAILSYYNEFTKYYCIPWVLHFHDVCWEI